MSMDDAYPDSLLLQGIAESNQADFKRLYKRYRQKVYFLALRFLSSNTEAEDVLQDIFLKLWVNRESLPEIVDFNAYLNRMIRNHLSNVIRGKTRNASLLINSLVDDGNLKINEELDGREMIRLVNKAVQALPPQQKKIFQLAK